ncbi:MAG: transglutaminase family protein [Sporichthyaceae bacterium]
MRESATAVRLTATAFAACILTTLVLHSVLDGNEWFLRTVAAVALVAVVGAAGRVMRVPRPAIPLAQGAVVLLYVTATYAREPAYLGWLPGTAALTALGELTSTGLEDIDSAVAPLTPSPAVTFLVVSGVATMAILVDTLAASYRLTALAGLPLVVLYVVPAAVLPDGLPGELFLLPAAGYLLLLVSDSRERLRRWGVAIAAQDRTPSRPARSGGVQRRVGVTVLALSVGVPALAPGLSDGAFGAGGLTADPGGGKTISTLNPLVSLRRDLVRPEDVDIMRIRTSSSRPDELYLRAVTLDTFDGEEWRAGRRSVRKFEADLPDPPGLATLVEAFPVDTTVEVLDTLALDYVPLPYPATRLEIDGSWRLDELTGNVVSQDGEKQITGTSYRVESRDLSPSKDDVTAPTPDPYLTPYLQLPESVPDRVRELAERATEGAEGPLEQGIALQQYFRNAANFTYDLRARPGTGQAAILDFLDDRRGYCEQFASTMAVMARHLGIPTRVNVGFTAGSLADDGLSRIISTHDAHAWPELFLPGIGWVRFEPTPSSASSSPSSPSWLTPPDRPDAQDGDTEDRDAQTPQNREESTTDEQGEANGGAPVEPPCDDPSGSCTAPLPTPPEPSEQAGDGAPWALISLLSIGGLLLLAVPALLRVGLRRRHIAGLARPGTNPALAAEIAWREVRDCAIDLGHHWPDARTPRQGAAALISGTELSEAARHTLHALTTVVERVRYAQVGAVQVLPALDEAVRELRCAMVMRAGRRERLRATFWPRSLFTRARSARAQLIAHLAAAQRSLRAGPGRVAARRAENLT